MNIRAGSYTKIYTYTAHLITLFICLWLLANLVACATPSTAPKTQAKSTHTPVVMGSQPSTTTPQVTATPRQKPQQQVFIAQELHGPTNFLLHTPLKFSQASGTVTDNGGTQTQLSPQTVQSAISSELKRFLFVADHNDIVKVYTPGATAPISTQITQLAQRGTAIQYTQVINSVTTVFNCLLTGNNVSVTYQQQYSGAATPTDPIAMSSSTVTVAFTTTITRVAGSDIPTAPTRGTYRLAQNKAVTLTWTAGQHATRYDIYRLIPNVDQQYQLIGNASGPTYTDASTTAKKSTTGIAYAIFAVGPTGVENPSDTVITIVS
ncbi:hypothetical protein [Dictyobacter arantiisoli]|uniref:Fibronectin type-III domain-containing protein n=1 Tax=Dictyobacter arantiisoli TaxID=2014874 RepID=A0A5A5T813_9CHLR|nr:hypothetical protein [Dictyobacter arantiisoli]GCF07542.1 hypothetical protein KDI_11060 [Dictyobacter arantiisoli]